MGYQIVRGPFMLLETVGMLHNFVNGIDLQTVLNRKKSMIGRGVIITEDLTRRMNRLQEIMDEVCRELDPKDPLLQRYFAQIEADCEDVSLANLMIFSFCNLEKPGLRENAEAVCAAWRSCRENGVWIRPESISTLILSNDTGSPGDLFDQIASLSLPGDFQMKLYGALRNFEKSIWELVDYIEPLSKRLEDFFLRDTWLFDEVEAYWHEVFQKTPPLEFLTATVGDFAVEDAGEQTMVTISLMNTNRLVFGMADNHGSNAGCNQILLGSGMLSNSMTRRSGCGLEEIGTILKTLSDKKRLEIIQRLSKERSYCHELAEAMGVDPGNMSRNLAALHHYGFLRQEREPFRCYYQTDTEVFRSFLRLVESVVLS